ncbi:hypothetical protein DEO72_LG8g348 [Vigna unguiculata]|uniref:Uncharacterized protein n=1 Tax=Vigna unguiculata TaxID=3917 RepID=A0A4D6MQZ1_VIGUN|nr:hypothetical protein DEO72_LG8g348 [Vigna unguiculata]
MSVVNIGTDDDFIVKNHDYQICNYLSPFLSSLSLQPTPPPSLVRWFVAAAGSLPPLGRYRRWFAAPPFPRRWVVAAAGSLPPLVRCSRWFAAPPFPRRWVAAAAGSLQPLVRCTSISSPLGRCRRWVAAAAGWLKCKVEEGLKPDLEGCPQRC